MFLKAPKPTSRDRWSPTVDFFFLQVFRLACTIYFFYFFIYQPFKSFEPLVEILLSFCCLQWCWTYTAESVLFFFLLSAALLLMCCSLQKPSLWTDVGAAFDAEHQHLYAVLPQHAHPEGGLEEEGGREASCHNSGESKKKKESLADLIRGWGYTRSRAFCSL